MTLGESGRARTASAAQSTKLGRHCRVENVKERRVPAWSAVILRGLPRSFLASRASAWSAVRLFSLPCSCVVCHAPIICRGPVVCRAPV
eukprot:2392032-Pyramimonas_sp.AAC.1